jgi:uncharacterized membrane protein
MNKERIATWLPLLAVVVALALRLIALDRKSLWLDEVTTLHIAGTSVDDIIMARWDPHPPLYYLLMHYWIGLGQSEFILRLPSAPAGAAAIPLLYWLAREWGGRWSATASAWLLAIAPLHIWYSQEARMYALVCTLGLASALSYTLAVRRGSLLAWGAWIVVTVAGLYTDYTMLLIVGAQVVLFGPLWRVSGSRRAPWWSALLALVTVSLLFAPQARMFAKQLVLSGGAGGYYISLQLLLSEWGIDASPSQLHTAAMLTGTIVLGAITVAAWVLSRRPRKARAGAGLTLTAAIVYLLILIASAIPRGLLVKRQALILLPYVLGGVVASISMQRYRSRLLIGLVLVILPLTGYVVMAQEQEGWREVARFLEQQAGPWDVILINASYMQQPFDYYYRGEVPRQGVGPGDVPEALLDVTASHERVWLVLSNDRYTDPQRTVHRWLDENCTLLGERIFQRVRVRLYDTG